MGNKWLKFAGGRFIQQFVFLNNFTNILVNIKNVNN